MLLIHKRSWCVVLQSKDALVVKTGREAKRIENTKKKKKLRNNGSEVKNQVVHCATESLSCLASPINSILTNIFFFFFLIFFLTVYS